MTSDRPSTHRPATIGVAALIVALIVAMAAALAAAPARAQSMDRGDLIVSGSATPNPAAGGGPVTYAVNVANESTVTATGVVVTIRLPQGNPRPVFVKCSTGVKGQPCTESDGTVTTTYKVVRAHTTVKVSLTLDLPLVPVATTFTIAVTAHATNAIGGEEPRDGSATIDGVALAESIPVVLLPSLRTATLACGTTVTDAFFQPGEHTVQFAASIGCARSPFAVTMSSSGKTLDLRKFKIVGAATNQTAGTIGIVIAPGATNVTIKGAGTKSKSGIEYFDYCLQDGGGNQGLVLSTFRCFRARSAGIDIVSEAVQLANLLVDLGVGGTPATLEGAAGGVGIHLGGAAHVTDCVVRRAARIGLWADVPASSGASARGIVMDGNNSRVEANSGIGILLDGDAHQIVDTRVEGDGSDGVSTVGVQVNGAGVFLDGLEVVEFGGPGIVAAGDKVTIKRSTVEAVGQDSFVVSGAQALLSGNSAVEGQRGFVVPGAAATLDTNVAENTLGSAFAVSGDAATVTGNTAKGAKADGFALSGQGGHYHTNKAETNVGTGFSISVSNGKFVNNTAKDSRVGGGFALSPAATGNIFKTNRAEHNKGLEWVISSGNIDRGGNSKNGATFQFTTNGGVFE